MNPIRKTIPRTVGAITILMLLMLMPQAFGQDRTPAITDLAIRPDTNQVELVVLGKIEYGYFPLSHPERLVFDFPGATLYFNKGATTDRDIEGADFTKVRLSQFSADPPIARLVLYLSEPATAVVDYSQDDGIFKINTMTEEDVPVVPDSEIRTIRRNLLTPVKSGTPAVSVKPEDQYVISNTDSDVLIRFPFLDAGKISVSRLNFPDRLHVRMYTADVSEIERPRFEPLKRGNIWNSIAKQWVSYIDRDNLGILDLTIYLYPDVNYTQSINELGIPEVRLFILSGEESDSSISGNIPLSSNSDFGPEVKNQSAESTDETTSVNNEAGSLFVVSEEDIAKANENDGTDETEIVSTDESEVDVMAEGSGAKETVISDAVETLEVIEGGKFGIDGGNDLKIAENPPHILPATGAGLPAIPTITRSNLIGTGMSAEDGTMFLKVGDVVVVRVSDLVRASVGNPKVAALNVISQTEILVTALEPGSTTLLTWEGENDHVVRQINVLNSTFTSEEEIRQVIDDDSIDVKIVMSGTSPGVVLEGSVDTEEESLRAGKIAALYAGAERVSNLIEITDPRQVLVKVRVVEIDKRALQERLSQFSAAGRTDNDDFTFGILTNLLDPENPGGGLVDTRTRPGIINGNATDMIYDPVDIMLNDLESNREGRVLSEPNVVAMSGHKAHFRVGGEVPYTYQNSNGVNVVEFREFGITLDMTPNVDSQGNVRLDVKPVVKSVDMALAIAGIPGFKTREMETSVQLKTGESLVIGGLIERELSEVVSKVPFLADIPILGELFKSRKFNENKTELVIFLTPYIIENLDASERIVTTDMKILEMPEVETVETEETTEQ